MSKLRDALKQRNEQFLKDVEHLVDKATPQLWHSYGTFPSGTKHTPEHTQMVEKLAGWLLTDDLLAELNDDEIGLLILACHYHDLGMSGTEDDNLTAEGRDRVRREHAVSIGDRILAQWRDFGFENETFAEILAQICKGHRPERVDGVAHWDNFPEERILGPERSVRVRVVSALIYAADELHIGEDRAPQREEEFNQIASVEARKHWRRHQAIQGPVPRDGQLRFEGKANTPGFERDLRQALSKAFQSVHELKNQLEQSGIKSKPCVIHFRWIRKKTWDLLITKVCGDLNPRSNEEIIEAVKELHRKEIDGSKDLSSLCIGELSDASPDDEIASLSDFRTKEFLVKSESDGDKYVLGKAKRVSDELLDAAKQADELDVILVEQDPPQYEHSLFQSEFGRQYVRDFLYPRLQENYHVNVASLPNSQPLQPLLESSPTAARITQLIKPPPSVLVHEDLLEFATIAGTCADLIHSPELILEPDYRSAVTQLFEAGADRLPKFLRFIEELAIIKKLSIEQVIDASMPSKEAIAQSGDETTSTFSLKQQFPVSRPDWSFSHLVLAGRRARVPVTILNTPAAPMVFKITDVGESDHGDKMNQPIAITFGPGDPPPAKTISYRARIDFDSDANQLSLNACKLSSDDSGKPLLFQFSPNKKEKKSDCKIQLVDSELSVGDVWAFHRAKTAFEEGDLETFFTIDSKPISPLDGANISDIIQITSENFIERLAKLKPDIPIPLYSQEEDVDRISNCDEELLREEFDSLVKELSPRRQTVTTIFLRLSSVDGQDYYEEFLGVQPPNFCFNAPTIQGENVSQKEVDEHWNSGKVDFRMEMSFREDGHQLAQELRNWVGDISKPFPFSFGDQDLKFHYCRTRMVMTFDKVIDRVWHLERRVTIRFRPVSLSERYGIEMEYWKAEGDHERATLLNELFQKAAVEEAKTRSGQVAAPLPLPDQNEKDPKKPTE